MADQHEDTTPSDLTLGAYLKRARKASGLTLRAVESMSESAVTNGYLSQIESESAQRPSPNILYHLAEIYGLDYGELLIKAGHRVPDATSAREPALNGLPLRALEGLTPTEQADVLKYISFIRANR
jgi:transcriptional regulator with XRE-family HTH domain